MSASGVAVHPARASQAPQFVDGWWTWAKAYDDLDFYELDVSDLLIPFETASSVTMVNVAGPTLGTSTISAAGVLTVVVTRGGGTARARIVTSGNRVLHVPLRWRLTDRGARDRYA